MNALVEENLRLKMREPEAAAPSLVDGGAYTIPSDLHDPDVIAQQLLTLPEFDDLLRGEVKIDWLLKRDMKTKGGRHILGTVYLPKVQGDLNPCFVWMLARLFNREPDYLIVLDQAYWYNANDLGREILVYHELKHCIHKRNKLDEPMYTEEGRPVWGLRGHDVEEFTAVVRRYGAWNSDIKSFCAAIIEHAQETQVSSSSS